MRNWVCHKMTLHGKMGYKSRSSIQKIEKGKTDMPQSKVKSFAEALRTTPEYLMGWFPLPDKEETKLIACYRGLSDERKKLVLGMIEQFCFDNSGGLSATL